MDSPTGVPTVSTSSPVITEYETLGDTEAVERLRQVPRSRFTYIANQIAADRREARARLEESLRYAALGFGVLTVEPDTSSPEPQYLPAELLETADAAAVTEDLIAAAADRWLVYVDLEENGQLVDTLTGVVDPDHVDWDTKGNTASHPAQGLRHADSVDYRDRLDSPVLPSRRPAGRVRLADAAPPRAARHPAATGPSSRVRPRPRAGIDGCWRGVR
ncbi:hypothetical protein ACFXG4_38200 [Nocardia sp. NPDC059246]|uniref:hypothetical protein n=1 Tax=unclassified Nocardia TaxID=2637762 RepID=UPI00369FE32E